MVETVNFYERYTWLWNDRDAQYWSCRLNSAILAIISLSLVAPKGLLKLSKLLTPKWWGLEVNGSHVSGATVATLYSNAGWSRSWRTVAFRYCQRLRQIAASRLAQLLNYRVHYQPIFHNIKDMKKRKKKEGRTMSDEQHGERGWSCGSTIAFPLSPLSLCYKQTIWL